MKFLFLLYSALVFFFPGGIEQKIDGYLKEKLSAYENFSYEVLSSPQVSGSETVEIDNNTEFRKNGNIAYVPAIIKEGNRERKAYISLRIKLYQKVYAATHKINKGEIFKKEDFSVITAEVTGVKGEPFMDLSSIEKLRCKLPVREGDVLTQEAVEKIPALLRGDKVLAYVQKGNVAITMDAFLREDGCEGETVRVLVGNKIFRAEVIDENSVKIIE